MDLADIALAVHWSLVVFVIAGIAIGWILWIRWLIQKLLRRAPKTLVARSPSAQPFWLISDFVVFLGAFIIGMAISKSVVTRVYGPMENTRFATTLENSENESVSAVESDDQSNDQESVQPAAASENAEPELIGEEKAEAEENEPAITDAELRDLKRMILLQLLTNLFAVTVTVMWMLALYRRSFHDFGLVPSGRDIALACVVSVWILSPVMSFSALLSHFVEYEHILIDAMQAEPSVNSFGLLFFSAVVVTPIAEEFGFRMLLQGGLQKMLPQNQEDDSIFAVINDWIPILVTSVLFALMHTGQGAAPYALFFFSIGVGYVYRQTGRLWVPIGIHMILNGLTLTSEFSRVLSTM